MAYETPLPSIRKLKQLADWGGPFPIQNRHLMLAAERFGLGDKVISFLDLFPKDAVFQTRREFIQECEYVQHYLRIVHELPMDFIERIRTQNELSIM